MRRPVPPVSVAGAAGLLLAAVLAGCSGGSDDGDDATDGATAAASAFVAAVDGTAASDVDLGDLPVSTADGDPLAAGKAGRAYRDVVEGLGDLEPQVELGSVDVGAQGTTARATLTWTWPTEPTAWTYEAPLLLLAPTSGESDWTVGWEPADVHPDLGSRDVLEATDLTAKRGNILGAGGSALVRPRDVAEVGIDRTAVRGDAAAVDSARRLAALVDVDADTFAAAVKAAGDLAFVPAITLRFDDVSGSLGEQVEAIPGGRLVGGTLPLAPTPEFAAPILGRVGDVTAEMIKDDPDTYRAGDQAGLSGLQLRYDDQLRGTDGLRVDAVGKEGDAKSTSLFEVDRENGDDLALTLDEDLELTAERLLADVGPASALVAIQPSTGDVLAAANGPGNDGQNLATYGQFAPGSTFKSVSSLALLRSGLTPASTVPCTPSITVDGKRFENYDDYPSSALGDVPLRTAIANSCNTAVISQAGRLKGDDLADAAASLGLGVDHDTGFPSFFGSVDPPASDTEAAADMIGQGTVLASPMAMATVIASVQQGETVVPRMLADADPVKPGGTEPTSQEVSQLRDLLRAVVTEGSGSLLDDVPGPPVIAKTGTAEFDDDDGDRQLHAWMIAAQGDLAVAVFVDVGTSGSGTAGPILEAFLRAAA